jgi:tRNA-2-methylthio-N6-dimethylallyladenosine synthase
MTTYTPKKYFIKTFGCQANKADSNTMAGMLEALGFERATTPANADLFIINTCSVRQKSEDKVYGIGKDIKNLVDKGNKLPFIVMAGCMVGSVSGERVRYEFDKLKRKTPWVNEYINPSQLMSLPTILKENNLLDEWSSKVFTPEELVSVQDNAEKKNAFVNISYGCDNFCTFCVVPYARGKEVSRSDQEILREVKHLVSRGFTHITLCGQNVNSWGLDMKEKFEIRSGSTQKLPFAELLRKVLQIKNLELLDFISSNPFDFTEDLIEVITHPKISNFLHMAVQSGNNEVLKKMNRRHTIEDFYNLVDKIKKVKPQVELGTDIIVGFPGETEEQFMDTVKLFKKVPFNVAYISIYSPRKGTPAERFYSDDVPLKEKKRRHAYLTKVWNETRPQK